MITWRSPYKDRNDIWWHSLTSTSWTAITNTSQPAWWQGFRRIVSCLFSRYGAFSACSDAVSGMPVYLWQSPEPAILCRQQRTQVPSTPAAPIRRVRFKKGPKRPSKRYINGISPAIGSQAKRGSVSKDDLDKDMEDYRAAASGSGFTTWLGWLGFSFLEQVEFWRRLLVALSIVFLSYFSFQTIHNMNVLGRELMFLANILK